MEGALFNHLWQSTLFAFAAWALTISLTQYTARTRYLIWFAVSVKFLIPLSILVALGLKLRPSSSIEIALLPKPLVSATLRLIEPRSMESWLDPGWGSVLSILWALGFVIVLARWWMCWLQARALVRAATPYPMECGIEVRVSTEITEPSVFGIRRPTLLLPSAVVSSLSAEELHAVIAHELCHVRNRDNLTAAVQMFVEAVFWYYPLVWWIGGQMLKERESACDETVIERGTTPHIYAEGILKACRVSLESRLGVMAAAGGSNLRDRVEAIVNWRPARKLSGASKASLVAIASVSFILPLLTGFAMPLKSAGKPSTHIHAHSFASASIALTPADSRNRPRLILTSSHLSMRNTSLRKLIGVACGLRERQVLGGPLWLDERYDIEADTPAAINRAMVLGLLKEKFGLQFIERNLESSDEDPL
jgi:bla regulator protein BlaR1